MNFPPNEPSSSPSGMGKIRTMQGDLKNIRASKNKVQPQSQAQPELHIEQPKSQENNPIPGSFGISQEPIVSKVEKTEQEVPILQKKIANIRPQKIEQKKEKIASEVIPVEKIIKKEEKKIIKPLISRAGTQAKDKTLKDESKKETLSKISDSDKNQERIRMAQEKIRPLIIRKEVSAPENILAVSESENKAAIQYAASLSKSAQAAKSEVKPIKIPAIEEESEYLPPELRLYRNTGARAVSFKKGPASTLGVNKPTMGTREVNDNILKKTDSFSPVKKTGKILKFVLLILVIGIGAYFIFIKETDLSFFLQWLPKNPKVTPELTVSPTPVVVHEKLDIKNVIYIKDVENLNLELANLKNQQYPAINIVSYSINNQLITGESLLNRLNIIIPNKVKNTVDLNNVFLLYFGVNKRLGLAIEVKDKEQLTSEMKVWEGAVAGGEINPIPYTLSSLLLGNFFELNQNIVFNTADYKGVTVNYANLPDSYRSVDYGVMNNFLIITTAKDDMFSVINEVGK